MGNPPFVVNGIVYVQTYSRILRDNALFGYNAQTGKILSKTPTYEQGRQHVSPTIFEDHVYAEGGYYGGMYSFDVNTGDSNWLTELGPYTLNHDWTPAVNSNYAIVYLNGYLNVLDRNSGKLQAKFDGPSPPPTTSIVFQDDECLAPVLQNDEAFVIHAGYLSLLNITHQNT